MNKYLTGAALLSALALTGSGLAVAQSQSPQAPGKAVNQCFFANEWNNWTAPDKHTMYLRVGTRRFYRLDFANSCESMTWPGVHLITEIRGSDSICSPLDIDMKVSDGHGIAEPCIVSKLTQLSDDEVAAIPKKYKP